MIDAADRIDPNVGFQYVRAVATVAENTSVNNAIEVAKVAKKLTGRALVNTLDVIDHIAEYHNHSGDELLKEVMNFALSYEGDQSTLAIKMGYISAMAYTTHSFSYREIGRAHV